MILKAPLKTLEALKPLKSLMPLKSLKALTTLAPLALLLSLVSCERTPWLELVDREIPVEFETDKIILDLDLLWDYDLIYDWKSEWWYDWDTRDDSLFGAWDIQEPEVFNIRRYYTGEDAYAPHTSVLRDIAHGNKFQARYKFGYYDILVFNDVNTIDGVQSLHFDEETSLEYITAYTNQSTSHTTIPHTAAPNYKPGYAFYQPEFLFAGSYDNLHVSDDPADYDSLIVETNTWYKFVPLTLTPVTYIYLTQVIIHNNNNRIIGVDGSGNLSGLSQSVNLNTHITSEHDISVNYPMRMKKDMLYIDSITHVPEIVDIAGGRSISFGLTGVNPYAVTRSSNSYQLIEDSKIKNYLEVNLIFYNGCESTFVFDVTKQVKKRYKGGVITVHIYVDDIDIPDPGGGGSGGGMFDAEVKDFEEEEHEFEM